MRPYRGLTKKGKWVYGWYCAIGQKHYIFDNPGWLADVRFTAVVGYVEVLPETVAQQVGRKDKNGKEIYGGDIIDGNLFDRRVPTMGEVVYDDEHGCWANKNEAGLTFLFKIAEIEIIGNITEDPELLK